ncbi:MAG: tetratricopeptide repeat protein [Desulfobacterales bacterium]|nr:tetratricopeptide repeat protein [Desulfobacterales bacterium]
MSKKRNKNKSKNSDNTSKAKSSSQTILFSTAVSLFEKGDLTDAKKIFRKILKKQPSHIESLNYMGLIYKTESNLDESINCFNQIITLDPKYANAYFNIGGIYIDQAQYNEALDMFKKVTALVPDYTNAWFNLGLISTALNKNEDALSYYKKTIELDPSYSHAYQNIASIYQNDKNVDKAIEYFEKTIQADPNYSNAWFNLGFIEMNRNNNEKAIKYFEKSYEIQPDSVETIVNIGFIKQKQELYDEAQQYYEKAISINPDFSGAHINLGNIYQHNGDNLKALECYNKAASINPSILVFNNICGIQKDLMNYDQANEVLLKMLEFPDLDKSDLASIHDTLIQICEWDKASEIIDKLRVAEFNSETKDVFAGSLMEFCGNTDLTLDEISEFHKLWSNFTEKLVVPYKHNRDSKRFKDRKKPRIAYISPDLREHSVGYLIKDIITSHNHEELEIYCYANHDPKSSDAFTQEMINSCKCFKYIKHMTDKAVADEIYNDEIDILIDLAGHTAGHRLRSMAYKPAPIQMTYLGYPNTTGMSRVDYRISDQYAETTHDKDYRYSENLIRLTNCFLTFKGFLETTPEPAKSKSGKSIIFGCFNNIQKLSPTAIKLWAAILNDVENSVLHLKAKQLNTTFVWNNIEEEFKKYDISSERLKCLGYAPTRQDHLKCYNDIDIALDTFPYNGTVTTLESLWMNIPVVTLVGESHAQRVGYSILKNLALDKLITFTEEEYVSRIVELAKHPEIIVDLKTKMRKRLIASSICNPEVFTRELELKLKKIWLDYLRKGSTGLNMKENIIEPTDEQLDGEISNASRLRMAMVKLKACDYESAIEISNSLLNSNGISYLAWYVLGASHLGLGDNEKAFDAISKSLSLNDNNAGAWKMLGELNILNDDIENANLCLAKILEITQSELNKMVQK